MSLLNNRPPESHLVSSTDLVLAESRKRVPNQSLRVYKGYSEGWHVPATAKIVEAFQNLEDQYIRQFIMSKDISVACPDA